MLNRSLLILPVGAIMISIIAFIYPTVLSGSSKAIVPLLGLVMFSMGMTLHISDFKRIFNEPKLIIIGTTIQYLLMPFIAWLLSVVLGLPILLATGLILLGACPGGTASNVICYLARGNLALSISLTAVSTILAVVLTPFVTFVYVNQSINVPIVAMMKNLVLIVVLPVLIGVLINSTCGKKIERFKSFLPLVSVLSIVFIIGVIVAKNKTELLDMGFLILLAVVLHNGLGLIAGYSLPKILGYDHAICKTIAIEVGMQNSGLGVVLASQHFSAIAALPAVLFSIWHNISGSVLAVVWSRKNES